MLQRDAEVVERIRRHWIDLDRARVPGDSSFRVTGGKRHDARIGVEHRNIRSNRDGPFHLLQSIAGAAQRMQRQPHQMMGVRVVRRALQ